jgi:hypothetical protein
MQIADFRNSAINSPQSAIESVSGPDAETSAAICQIAKALRIIPEWRCSQLQKSPVGSPAANSKQQQQRNPFRRIERQSWQQHVKMLLSF